MPSLVDRFKALIAEKELFEDGDALLLSMSAGKDSMFMLSMVLQVREELNLRLGVFHLNHLTRGDESLGDEVFLREYLTSHGIEPFFHQYDFSAHGKPGLSFEERARAIRYSMLREIKNEKGFNKILTAHNLEDNAETIFMRILRGTGMRGLEGIPETERGIVRPILTFHREEIYAYLRENEIPWREDSSNFSNKYDRNYIRNEVFPVIESRFPRYINKIAQLSNHVRESRLLLEDLIAHNYGEYVHQEGHVFFIDISSPGMTNPLLRLIISEILRNNYDVVLSNAVYEEIFRKLKQRKTNLHLYSLGKLQLRKGLFKEKPSVIISKEDLEKILEEWCHIIPPEREGSVFLTEVNAEVHYRRCSRDEYQALKEDGGVAFSHDNPESVIAIRNRRQGDRIVIETGTKKIKDFMIEKKLDTVTKKKVPLITVDNEVAVYLPLPWAEDAFRVSKKYWIDNNSENIIILNYMSS